MADANYNPEHKAALDDILLGMPGVKGSKAFGYPAYKVNGKIFAFVGSDGATIKLGEKRVAELAGTQPELAVFEVDTGIFWKGWLSIAPLDSKAYADHEDLMVESMNYVASLA
jgi:hypothetical protein